jgi:quercetin dioxygenase-like cupin family protein
MSIPHAASGELIDVSPLGKGLRNSISTTLIRAPHLEVFRLILEAGREIPDHKASGAITIQCLEGAVELQAHGKTQILHQGIMIYLNDAEPHSVKAIEDSSLLITILLRRV